MMRLGAYWVAGVLLLGCGGTSLRSEATADLVRVSVVGTNDSHGQLERVAVLSGYLQNLRAAREADGGAVILLSGGDMWQGTLESNLFEGESMVAAYNHVGYTAAAVGNHEFDYGPEGERATPEHEGDLRRGALLARVREANFPLLSANFLNRTTGEPVSWPGIEPYVVVEAAGLRIGIIGASTEETLETTIAANVDDLEMASVVQVVTQHARSLREQGVDLVFLAIHAGGHCTSFDDPNDLSSCDPNEEVMRVAEGLQPGLVDAIVGGHTHKAIAHRVNGIPVLESYAHGRAFGRVDFVFDRRNRRIVDERIHPPHEMCQDPRVPVSECEPGDYEGAPVAVDTELLSAMSRYLEAASDRRDERIGVEVEGDLSRAYDLESPLGNLLADLMHEARTGDFAMINGGGVRAALLEGPLTYGAFYRVFPFDNRFAFVNLRGDELEALIARNLQTDDGIFLFSGIRAVASCRGAELEVEVRRADGRRIGAEEPLRMIVSDFLATTSDPLFAAARARGDVEIESGAPIREELVEVLNRRGGVIRADDPALYDEAHPRIRYEGPRPLVCGQSAD